MKSFSIFIFCILILISCDLKRKNNKSEFNSQDVVDTKIIRENKVNSDIVYFKVSECDENCVINKLTKLYLANNTLKISLGIITTDCMDFYFYDFKVSNDTIDLLTGLSKYVEIDSKGNQSVGGWACICYLNIDIHIKKIKNNISVVLIDGKTLEESQPIIIEE